MTASTLLQNATYFEDGSVDFDCHTVQNFFGEKANQLSGGMFHKSIICFLSKSNSGTTVNQLKTYIPGLRYFLTDVGKQVGTKWMPPKIFLPHLEGVTTKIVYEDKELFFADPGVSLRTLDGKEGKYRPNDEVFAKDMLNAMRITKHLEVWPENIKELSDAMQKAVHGCSNTTIAWLKEGIDPGTQAKTQWEVTTAKMTFFLLQMGIISGTNKALVWDYAAARANAVKLDAADPRPSLASTDSRQENGHTTDGNPPRPTVVALPPLAVPTMQVIAGQRIVLIDTGAKLDQAVRLYPFDPAARSEGESIVAIDCEGVPSNLFLVQVATSAETFLFDGVKLGETQVAKALATLVGDESVTKLFHDLHNDVAALARIGGIEEFNSVVDTQIALECLTGNRCMGFNQMLEHLGQQPHPLKHEMKAEFRADENPFAKRPLPKEYLEYAAMDASLLLKAKNPLMLKLGENADPVQRASELRAKIAIESGGSRRICFDVTKEYTISSYELIATMRPDDMLGSPPLEVFDDSELLLRMLPEDLLADLIERTDRLSDIVLDKGRRPLAWIQGKRVYIGGETRLVSREDISGIVEQLGGFGSDNRAGIERQLHRISAMRNRNGDVIGLTMRVGRHVSGNATIIADLLFRDNCQSILFVGEPGSGKTTVVREVTKQLAEQYNVCIVDTSNEIAGDGDVPHPCVGCARRMMVPTLDKQSSVMIECVQNHTPEVMVIDEIGRPNEVEAARTCKQRGVRLIASAHGDLRKLVKNPKLRGLIGGVETVILGDNQAKAESKRLGNAAAGLQKLKAQRAGPPTFDIIVELRRGVQHEWRVIFDVGEAVDCILDGRQFKAQRRTRDPESGFLALDFEMA